MKKIIEGLILDALERAKGSGDLILASMPDIVVEKPKDEKHGDFASTVAMSLARTERKKPRDIAEAICRQISSDSEIVDSVEIAGPGFINIKLSRKFFCERLKEIVALIGMAPTASVKQGETGTRVTA